MPINVPGFALSTKTPAFRFAVILGGPGTNAGAAVKTILCYGNILQTAISLSSPTYALPAGTAPLASVVQVFDSQSAGVLFGRGSELHLMCASALTQYPSATLYAIPVAKPSGSPQNAAATLTFAIPSTAVYSPLTVNLWVCGRFVQYNTGATDTPNSIAQGVAQVVCNLPDLPIYAQYAGNVCTFTFKNPSARGNQATVRAQLVSGSSNVLINGANNFGYLSGLAAVLGNTALIITGTSSTTTAFDPTANPVTTGVAIGQVVTLPDSATSSEGTVAATTIAAGSSASTLSTVTPFTFSVASTANFPAAGQFIVVTSSATVDAIVSYTGITSGTFTGCLSNVSATSANTGGAVTALAFTQSAVSNVSSTIITGTAIGRAPSAGMTVYWANPSGQTAHLYGGTGTDSLTAALAVVAATLYDRHVIPNSNADTGSTGNINALATQLNTMAGVMTDIWQQGICALTETYAAAVTDSTAVNQSRMQMVWHYNSEYGPGEVAAAVAAGRLIGDSIFNGQVIGEATNVASNLNYLTLGGIPVQPFVADRPLATQIENALNNGLAPLGSSGIDPGFAWLVASITSRFLDAQSLPNYAVYKTKIVTVSDFVAYDLRQDLATTFAGYNLAPDTPDGSPIKIPLVISPRGIKGRIALKLAAYELNGILVQTALLLPQLQAMIDPTNPGRCLVDVPEIPINDLDGVVGNIRQQSQIAT